MQLISKAINRPVTTLMAFSAVVLVGAISLFNLPVNLMPDVDFPILTVETRIAGYLPQEVESLITKPIENYRSVRTKGSSQ